MNVHRYYPAPHQNSTIYLCAPLYSRTSIFSQNSAPSRHITNLIPDLIHDDLVSFVNIICFSFAMVSHLHLLIRCLRMFDGVENKVYPVDIHFWHLLWSMIVNKARQNLREISWKISRIWKWLLRNCFADSSNARRRQIETRSREYDINQMRTQCQQKF
jgi:hypothetical protein